ncbi:MAG: hypothetical protein DRP00_03560 [Candidatus Aenigmatarchaeota archaeon]|nr:MAG: hypothetical protein DRP00_03560 [Candidatus Aenigmarchaeota archaeon]
MNINTTQIERIEQIAIQQAEYELITLNPNELQYPIAWKEIFIARNPQDMIKLLLCVGCYYNFSPMIDYALLRGATNYNDGLAFACMGGVFPPMYKMIRLGAFDDQSA